MRYSVISNTAQCCMVPAEEGVNDFLFDAGVRMVQSDLSKHEAQNLCNELYQRGQQDYEDFMEFKEVVLAHLEQDSGRAWKGRTFNPWDNTKDVPEYY